MAPIAREASLCYAGCMQAASTPLDHHHKEHAMPMLKQVVPVPLRPRHLTKSMRELPVFITINTDGTIVVDLDEADVANAIAAILNLPLHEGD